MFCQNTVLKTISLGVLMAWVQFAEARQDAFDYYLLSLSWSPEFCSIKPDDRQCGRGYGLVLHGVWPQYSNGYPSTCSNERMPAYLVRQFPSLYPSEKLAFHEWRKHGTCSGLEPLDYLKFSQKLKGGFIAPTELQNLTQPMSVTATQMANIILAVNPGLKETSIAFTCSDRGRFLQEIMVCYDKEGEHTVACGADVKRRSQRSCGQKVFWVRSIR